MIKLTIKNDGLTNTNLLKPKNELNPKFWTDMQLDAEASQQLKIIAEDVIRNMNIEAKIEKIIITGSSASYNWHKLSDIDLHIVFDFEQIDENFELVKRMLDQSRINWNKTHDITIRGHEVEIYFQDSGEPHASNGIWSITNDQWEVEPEKLNPELDLNAAEKKAEVIVKSIDHILSLFEEKKFSEAHDFAAKIKSKISNMRQAGLAADGIYSPENLAFKMLRNSNYLEKLSNVKVDAYDNMMSIQEIYIKDYFNDKKDPEYLKFEGEYNLEELLDPNGPAPWDLSEKDKQHEL